MGEVKALQPKAEEAALPACCLPAAAPDPMDSARALAAAAAPAVERVDEATQRLTLVIENLSCAGCVPRIEEALAKVEGLTEGRVNLTTRRLRLAWQAPAELPAILKAVLDEGYRLAPYRDDTASSAQVAERRFLLRCLAVAGFAAGNVMLLSVSVWSGLWGEMGAATRDFLHWIAALIAMPAVAYAGRPFFRSAVTALSAARLNMDVPISLAVVLATAMSLFETMRGGPETYFDAALTLLFFLLLGRLLDQMMRGRARSAAENLLSLKSDSALRILPDGRQEPCALGALQPDDIILVRPGDRVPADGKIVEGQGSLDVSAVTGESLPQAVSPGSRVHAGTLNLDSSLKIAVTATGERTLLAEVLRLVEAAEQGRARYVRLADRAARIYAPAVHLLALFAFVGALAWGLPWQAALMNAIAVLIVTCPCALGLAVPAVQVAAVGRLFRQGLLVKSGDALERLAEAETVVLDKTGTLTLGRPRLIADAEVSAEDLQLAAQLASLSRHPLAQALVQAAGPVALPAFRVTEVPGRGLIAQLPEGALRLGSAQHCGVEDSGKAGGSMLWLRHADGRAVAFRFSDSLRSDARETVAALKRQGYRLEILSGDREAAVAAVARDLDIETWRAGVLPSEKARHLAALQAEGRKVLMVGDGLNDAAALAAAHVSLSPADASEASQIAADVLFQGERLAPLLTLLSAARQARRLVLQNFAIALTYNLIAVPLAMAGLITPLLAAIFMSASSILVTGNAARAARTKEAAGEKARDREAGLREVPA